MLNDDLVGCEITHDCMALIPTHCPFKLSNVQWLHLEMIKSILLNLQLT